jgi:TRAP-type mannitol/chloroaromatic compound transport system permease small subunit
VPSVQALLRVSRLIDTLTEAIGKLLGLVVIALILLGVFNVITRYIGPIIGRNLYTQGAAEAQNLLFSLTFFLGFAYLLQRNGNVRVDFLYGNWSDKRKALVNLLGHLLFLIPFCILALYVGLPVLTRTLRSGETSGNAGGLQIYPLWVMFALGIGLLILQSLSELIKHAAVLAGVTTSTAVAAEEYVPEPIE